MLMLGIETSCDETACAVVSDTKKIKSHIVLSQLKDHQKFGGVVPELAARSHLKHLPSIVAQCVREANISLTQLDGIAATAGPGLIGGVMVGVSFAKALAAALNKPFLAINHLEAHALTPRLTTTIPFPYLLLLVSGGHCQILIAHGVGHYTRLGSTLDDAVGEAFDKTAKLLGLPYPGGPIIEKLAGLGDPHRFPLPKPLIHRTGCDFSFSGLKTAVRHLIESLPPFDKGQEAGQTLHDVCASFQETVRKIVVNRCENALKICQSQGLDIQHLVVAGGVAANQNLRHSLQILSQKYQVTFAAPPLDLCTDNGAMVAWAGVEKLSLGLVDNLNFATRSRWPLSEEPIKCSA